MATLLSPNGLFLLAILVLSALRLDAQTAQIPTLLSAADGTIDETFISGPGFDADVLDMVRQPDGKIVAVGRFKAPVGYPSSHIVRLDAQGNIDQTFRSGVGTDADVSRIRLLSDGRILISGSFTTYDGEPAPYFARLYPDGSLDKSFMTGSGPSGGVHAFDIDNSGRIVFAGNFTSVNGVSTGRVARIDASGNVDTTFQTSWNFNGWFGALKVLSDGKILVGGQFSGGLVRLNSNGTTDRAIVVNGPVRQIEETPSGVYICGNFAGVVSSIRRGIARLIGNTVDPTFNPTSNLFDVSDFVIAPDGKIFVSGELRRPDGSTATVMRLNPDGSDDRLILINSLVYTMLTEQDGSLIAGGRIAEVFPPRPNAPFTHGVVKLEPDGNFVPNYLTSTAAISTGTINTGPLEILQLADGKMLGWGDAWRSRGRLVRLTRDALIDGSYDPVLPEIFEAASLQSDGTAYVGGRSGGGDPTFRIRRVLSDGTLDPGFNPIGKRAGTTSSGLRDLAVQPDGRVIAVGEFVEMNGQPRLNIARLMPNGELDPTFNLGTITWGIYNIEIDKRSGRIFVSLQTGPGVSTTKVMELGDDGSIVWQAGIQAQYPTIRGMQQTTDGDLLLVGDFTSINSVPVRRIARLNPDGTPDQGFIGPTMVNEYGAFQTVFELPDGRIMVGGAFWNIESARNVGHVTRLFSDGRIDPSFSMSLTCHSSCTNPVRSIVRQPDGKLIVSGSYEFVNGKSKYGNVRLQPFNELASISGRVLAPDGRPIRNVPVTLVDQSGTRRVSVTSSFGLYSFTDVAIGTNITITVTSKRYRFTPRQMSVEGSLTDLDMVGLE